METVKSVETAAPPASGAKKNDVAGLQQKMKGDPQIMNLILSLQNDPAFQKLMQDPEIMAAIQKNDYSTLMSNPDFIKIMNNSTVRRITEKVKSE